MARTQEIFNETYPGETLYNYFIHQIRVKSIVVTSNTRDHISFTDKLVHINVNFHGNQNYQALSKISKYNASSCLFFCNITVTFNYRLSDILFIQINSSVIIYIFFSIVYNFAILVIIFVSHLSTNYINKSLFELINFDKLIFVLIYSIISHHYITYITFCTILVILLVNCIMICTLNKALFFMKYLVIDFNPSKPNTSLYNPLIFRINLLVLFKLIVSASQLILYTSQTLYYVFLCQNKDLYAYSLKNKSSSHGKTAIFSKIIPRHGIKLIIHITTIIYDE